MLRNSLLAARVVAEILADGVLTNLWAINPLMASRDSLHWPSSTRWEWTSNWMYTCDEYLDMST